MGSISKTQTLVSKDLPVESHAFDKLSLQEVASVLENGLRDNFEEASVTVVECEDLTKSPWNLAAPGISGSPRMLDIGGVPYLTPSVQKHKLYDMRDYPNITGLRRGLVIGAGAAPWPYLNRNAEMMPNLFVEEDKSISVQKTKISRTFDHDNSYATEKIPAEETRNSLLGNLFISEGKTGQVLKIHCKKRKGTLNFTNCMKESLEKGFPGQFIGLGGVFHIVSGRAKVHIMPDFSPCPLHTDKDVESWLKFYEVSAPFTVLSTLVAHDPGLDLRPEHSHGWGEEGQGGHYHGDTTPDMVEYRGYYSLPEEVYRVDRPIYNTHKHIAESG